MSKQHSMKQYTFSSSLAPWMERFIAEKRSLNYLYNTESKMLARFDKYLVSEQYDLSILTKEIVEKYTAPTPYESVRNHKARYLIIQQFGKYLCRLGVEAHVSSFICKINQSDFFVPYIFSDREIVVEDKRLFAWVFLSKTRIRKVVEMNPEAMPVGKLPSQFDPRAKFDRRKLPCERR